MAVIDFSYLLKLSKEDHEKYAQAGLYFCGYKSGRGYDSSGFLRVEVRDSDDVLAENLARLDYDEIDRLTAHLGNSYLSPVLDEAKELHKLYKMDEKSQSGYVFEFLDKKPSTWEVQDKIGAEKARLQEKLSRHGIIDVRIGQEMEFNLPKKPVEGFGHWTNVKANVLNDLKKEIEAASGEEKLKLEAKRDEFMQFNAREVLMYDMIELDDRTKDILEPLFGRSHDGDGYYDGQNCLELKLKHCSLGEHEEKQKIVQAVLVEKAREYGLSIPFAPNSHLSFSFWDEKGNLMEPAHPDYATKGKVLVEGITRGIYDSMPVIMNDYAMESSNGAFRCSVDRDGLLRVATKRVEIRPNRYVEEQHADLMCIPVLAGALDALENQHGQNYEKEYVQARLIGNGSFIKPKDTHKVFTHVLSNAEINPDGSLVIPENYVRPKARDIAYELGLICNKPVSDAFSAFDVQESYAEHLLEFIKKIRVDMASGEPKLVFPKNCPEGYKIEVPEQGRDKAPSALVNYNIDTEALAKNVRLLEIEDRLVITEGYFFDTTRQFGDCRDKKPKLFDKLERMKASPVFERTLSPEFRESFIEVVDASIQKPFDALNIPQEKKEDLKALLQAAYEVQMRYKEGGQWINLHREVILSKPNFVPEVIAVLAEVADGGLDMDIASGISADQGRQQYMGDKLFLPAAVVEDILPNIQADPEKVAAYKQVMGKDILAEMLEIAAGKPNYQVNNVSAIPMQAEPGRAAGIQ